MSPEVGPDTPPPPPGTPTKPSGRSSVRRRLQPARLGVGLAWGALLALTTLIAWRCLTHHLPFFGLYHDDALYVVGARALAEGHGYSIISLPGSPAQTKYPIFYPLLISFIWRLNPAFPENLLLIEAANALTGIAFATVAVLYLVKTRRVTPALGLVIAGATLLNIRFLSFLPIPMSDMTYGLLSVLALWLTESLGKGSRGRSRSRAAAAAVRSLLAGVAFALATLTRTTGAALAPACAAYLALRKQYWAAGLALGSFLLVAIPYWWWSKSSQVVDPPTVLFYTSHTSWMARTYEDLGAVTIVARKADDLFQALPRLAIPFAGSIRYASLDPLQFFLVYRMGWGLVWSALLLGMLRDLVSARRCLLPVYLACYFAGMLIWPGFLEWRLLLVVLPFIYYFLFRGFRWFGWLARKGGRRVSSPFWRAATALLSLAAAVYLLAGSAWSSLPHAGSYPRRLPERSDIGYLEEFADAAATYKWIREHTPRDAVIISNNDPLVFLATGRRGMQPSAYEGWRIHSLKLITPETLLASIRDAGAQYVLIDPTYAAGYEAYRQLLLSIAALSLEQPDLLTPVYTSPHGVMTLLRVNEAGARTQRQSVGSKT